MDAPARTRRLTDDLPGLGGRIRAVPEDFVVEEVPLYAPLGDGEHVHFVLEKRGISTFEALMWLSKAIHVSEHSIGYAGLKDAGAVTRQTMSVHRVPVERVLAVATPKLRVLSAARHPQRVRIGHLEGNRFTIRIRGADLRRLPAAREALARIVARGMPNAYGAQRFGLKQDGHLVGLALLRDDHREALAHLLGRPHRREGDSRVQRAREAYDEGDLEQAQALWPMKHRVQKRALAALLRTDDPRAAFAALGNRARRIYLSAWQSWVFNRCLDARLAGGSYDRLIAGDLAWQHGSGAMYRVRDVAAEAPRAARFEASPTGPLPGYELVAPTDDAAAIERAVLSEEAVDDAAFRAPHVRVRGARRPLRVPVADASIAAEGADAVLLRFTLPPGSFATVLLRELMKNDTAVEGSGPLPPRIGRGAPSGDAFAPTPGAVAAVSAGSVADDATAGSRGAGGADASVPPSDDGLPDDGFDLGDDPGAEGDLDDDAR